VPVDTHSCLRFSHTAICTIIVPTASLPSVRLFAYLLLERVGTELSNCLSLTVMAHPALYGVHHATVLYQYVCVSLEKGKGGGCFLVLKRQIHFPH